MSLGNSLKKAAFAAPFVFAMAAANSQSLPTIEPSATDLSKPISGCVETTPNQPGLTAWDKLVVVMNARNQMIAVSGDKLVVGGRQERIFTISNTFNNQEGYIVSSPSPKAERSTSKRFCFEPTRNAIVVDNSKLDFVPSPINKGELGVALTNNHNLGSKVAVMGLHFQGSLYVVHFNPSTNKGAYKEADGQGGRARDLATFENIDYSSRMKTAMQQSADAKASERVAVANQTALTLK